MAKKPSARQTPPTKKRPKKKNWHEVHIPYELTEKFKGVSIGYDERIMSAGFFVFTHRARSGTYSSINRIPDSIIKKVAATG